MTAPVVTIDTEYTGEHGVAACYLIEDGGRAAFVETNTVRAVPRLLGALAETGLTPEQVDLVLVTHAHLDHAGGAGELVRHLPNAVVMTHPKAAPHLIDPSRIRAGATEVYGEARFAELYGELVPIPAERVRSMADGEEVRLADRPLRFLHTRGHANHHLVVHDPLGDAVFTGDAFGIVYPYLQRNGTLAFPSTTPTDFDADAALASVDRIAALGTARVFPTHMAEQRDVAGIADALRRQLRVLGEAVDRADREGIDGDALDAFFGRLCAEVLDAELASHGFGDDPVARKLVALDAELNGQGLAFAVRKRRFKRG
ncbi:MAG: MBL fold metallo-hydrolase [Alphaproteobacteria bacterium]|nr:MBL fold metallo-hydrolase [Alphaproteobacteria bacterium]